MQGKVNQATAKLQCAYLALPLVLLGTPDFNGLTLTTLLLPLQGRSDQVTRPSTSQRKTGVWADAGNGSNSVTVNGSANREDFFMVYLMAHSDFPS
jgi:hypothetical protein